MKISQIVATFLFAVASVQAQTIVDVAVGNPAFSTLVSLVTDAGLVETLSGAGPFTVFAPTNDAFAAVPQETLDALAADPELLVKVLTYHVLPAEVMSTDLAPGGAQTVQGGYLTISTSPSPTVNGIDIVSADVKGSNGVIHVIDQVIIPPMNVVEIAAGNPDFSTLVQLVTDAGLVDTLSGPGPFTVFAPTNAAFAALPKETLDAVAADKDLLTSVLTYHVLDQIVPSSAVTSSAAMMRSANTLADTAAMRLKEASATVVIPDVYAINGIVHAVDTVLVPPTEEPAATEAPAGTEAPAAASSSPRQLATMGAAVGAMVFAAVL